jgi:translation initiation factor eIF-2B subunit alpha
MSRNKIGQLADSFIRDGSTILTHGFSRVVISVLLRAFSQGKRFTVVVTEARPDDIGYQTAKRLRDANIPVNLITDAAVAHYMDRIDLVIVGAEGIVENGGIINKTGTHQLSIGTTHFLFQ